MNYEPISLGRIQSEQVEDYARASLDFNPIHLDSEFAKKAGLSDRIAHGMLSMGLASKALEMWGFDLSRLQNFSSKFKEKLFLGEELQAVFISSKEVDKGLEIQWKLTKGADVEVLLASAVFGSAAESS